MPEIIHLMSDDLLAECGATGAQTCSPVREDVTCPACIGELVHIYLARTHAGAFERKLLDSSEFDYAGAVRVRPTRTDDRLVALKDAAEIAFAICNSYPSELHCAPEYLDQVRTYRAGGHRSLSVGDVIATGESMWFCASAGWDPIYTPTDNLITAMKEAMPSC